MARGWESKSIESQIEDASRNPALTQATRLNEAERQQQLQLNNLMLSRTRILAEIQTACNARFREQLARELAYLDEKIAALTN
jgi:hypothetical protein